MHGGAHGSGAPRGNRNAVKHGLYTRDALARRRLVNRLLRDGARLLSRSGNKTAPVTSRQRGRPASGLGSEGRGERRPGAAPRRPRDGPPGGASGS
jgi:hypothetical protein